ncbi:hypothetical protein PSTG_11462 [Puccinia striiformis f. sp. tritici PST-78]|uniref:Uncharacterized protein n=1 Tax=Puccinia striiformis f. sp. tritici PST-78 TaxID=1165861 RepID=A0A0L0V7N1_9BASI|nr:hypothetical protein PSTG_11462 [Puccinia striiformis f. sp. tritici PST-78]
MKEFLRNESPGINYTPALHHVKSGYAYLKTFIKNSTRNFFTQFNLLSLAVEAQIMSVHESIGKDTMKKLDNVPKAFIPLLGQISTFAIKECKAHHDCLTRKFDPTKACSQTLTKGVGILCAHRIAEILETRNGLEPEDFPLQWHLKYNPKSLTVLTVLLLDKPSSNLAKLFEQFYQIAAGTHTLFQIKAPNVKKIPTGRPSSKSTSTTRNPLAFKIVESETEKAQKLFETGSNMAQKATNELKKHLRPNKKQVTKATSGSGRRSQQTKETKPSNKVGSNEENAIGKSPGKVKTEVPAKEERQSPGKIKGEKEGNGSSYGEEVLGYSTDGHKKAGFLRIQEEMIAETTTNRATYHRLQGGEEEVVKIIDGLTMCTTETIVPPEKWLNKLLHGQILANAYSISLTFLFSLVSPLEGHSS